MKQKSLTTMLVMVGVLGSMACICRAAGVTEVDVARGVSFNVSVPEDIEDILGTGGKMTQEGKIELPTGGKVSVSDPILMGSEGVDWYLIEFHHQHRGLTGEDLPDLVVPSPASHSMNAAPGEEIVLDVTVATNTGNANAVPQDGSTEWDTTLYLSDDQQFAENTDTKVAEFALSELAAGASVTRTLTYNAPAEPATYYLAAKTDDVNAVPESDETNNWSEVVTLTVADSDADNDGLPDWREQRIVDAKDGDAIESVAEVLPEDDFDADTFTNIEEYRAGTDPCSADPEPIFVWMDAIVKLRRIGDALQAYRRDYGDEALPPWLTTLVDEGYLSSETLQSMGDVSNGTDPHPYDSDDIFAEVYEPGISFFYEFSNAPCSWRLQGFPGQEDPTWYDLKMYQLHHGGDMFHAVDDGYDPSRFPLVRFFWVTDDGGELPGRTALSLAYDLETVFASELMWEGTAAGLRVLPDPLMLFRGRMSFVPLWQDFRDMETYSVRFAETNRHARYGEIRNSAFILHPDDQPPDTFSVQVEAVHNGDVLDTATYNVKMLPNPDEDRDNLEDEWEQQIVDADPDDDIDSVSAVLPGDDFDEDGRTNLDEYNSDGNSLGWTCTLNVAGAGDDYPSVGFGMHAGASEDEDEYDLDAPLAPPVDEAAVYFNQLRVSYQRDIRPIAEAAEWFLVVQAGLDDPVSLDWNATECLDAGRHLSLFAVDETLNPVNGTFLNMKRTSQLSVPAGHIRQFIVRTGPTLSVDIGFETGWNLVSLPFEPAGADTSFETGWNLVSLPFEPAGADTSPEAILQTSDNGGDRGGALRDGTRGAIYTDAVWEWINEGAAGTYRYAHASELNALTGYWIYADAPATVTVRGIPVDSPELNLMMGWNLVGCPFTMPLPDTEQYNLRARCWQWNADTQSYLDTDTMRPSFGYWLNAGEDDVDIPLEAGSDTDDGPGEQARSQQTRSLSPAADPNDVETLVAGNTAFALELYDAVNDGDSNLFMSPYSISVALGMTYAGARGDTEFQMADTLHFDLTQDRLHPAVNALDLELASRGEGAEGKDEEPFRLHIVNQLWGEKDYAFLPDFLDTLAVNYGAGLRLMDFRSAADAARIEINDWIARETEQRIQNLIPQGGIDTLTRLVLTNAIYFNAAWASPFMTGNTTDGTFAQLDGTESTVPMMSQEQVYLYVDRENVKAVELPYDGHELSMVLLVPDSGFFEDFEESLTPDELNQIIGSLSATNLRLTLPKFEYNAKLSLAQTLATMGMPAAFSNAANFSGMDGTHNLRISDVFHKAFVAVDESGTEAAAATTVAVGTTSIPSNPVELTIDHPFIFLIRDVETETILFLGRFIQAEPAGRR